MSPQLSLLQPYPFQKLKQLFADVTANPALAHINLSIGEPKHATPQLVTDALIAHFDGLSAYPATLGSDSLRQSISTWLARRYSIAAPNPATEIIPVNGSREALFAFAQTIIDNSGESQPIVLSPNPFYQIYEGAAFLAKAKPYFVNCNAENRFQPDWDAVPAEIWQRTQLVFTCSPGNPTGAVASLADWKKLFTLSDQYGFVIASDECYSEIYFGDEKPLGALEAASLLGRDYHNLVIFSSLSKRSNVPGLRSGFVAGDAKLLASFLLYRTYHGDVYKRQETLPFMGSDIWNGYELSWLNSRGKPQVAIAVFTVPASSPNIIESKSFKLYLNSFNQTKLETREALQNLLQADLSAAAGANISVQLIGPEQFHQQRLAELDGYCIDNLDIEVDQYSPQAGLLKCDSGATTISESLTSNLLKSNCLVTGQPDWASIQISYTGKPINRESLLRYLISFRNHNEFHEQCVERIFMDIQRDCAPMKLAVYARYTRRGGLDINPYRCNFSGPLPTNLRGARQ